MSDIATVAQMRVIDFEPMPEFRAASKGERIDPRRQDLYTSTGSGCNH